MSDHLTNYPNHQMDSKYMNYSNGMQSTISYKEYTLQSPRKSSQRNIESIRQMQKIAKKNLALMYPIEAINNKKFEALPIIKPRL